MTTPNSLEPPRLATWLLERFSPAVKNPALAGDLIEGFNQGRSPGWYWRQVFWAIVMASLNFWGSLVYAVGCSALVSAGWFFMFPWAEAGRGSALPAILALYEKGYRIPWPWSLAYRIAFVTLFQAVIVTFALGAYLAFFHTLRMKNLLRGLMVAFVALGSGNVALPFLAVALSSMRVRLTYGWLVLVATPAMVGLILGMWQGNRHETFRPSLINRL